MSAHRDPSEKITFLFTPMGKLVRKIRDTEVPASGRARVLKSEDLRARKSTALPREYRAPELKQAAPAAAALSPAARQIFEADTSLRQSREAMHGLRQNLQALDDLQKRFRFLLQELDDLIAE